MVTMMTSRFAEWNRRAKENRKAKPFIMKDMEDELQAYMDEEDEELYGKEEARNIESSVAGPPKPQKITGPKKIKLTKNYTIPDIDFCKRCMKDVFTCNCQIELESQKKIEEQLKSQGIDMSQKKNQDILIEPQKKLYRYQKKPPSIKDILESQANRCVDMNHQQYKYLLF